MAEGGEEGEEGVEVAAEHDAYALGCLGAAYVVVAVVVSVVCFEAP